MKKLLMIVLCLFLTACTNTPAASSAAETKTDLTEEYTQLAEDHSFYMGEKENLKTFIEHGTGILTLGFPQCPWCQAYLPLLDEVLKDCEAKSMYYNIRIDKTEDRPFYDEIAALIEEVNDTGSEIILYDNDGKPVIYMPLILFIEGGRITAFNNETSMESSDVITPEKYWTEEKITALKNTLEPDIRRIKEAQDANDEQGCDKGCEVKPGGENS